MKTEYLKNQLLLRTEQDNEFVRNIDLLQIRLLDAIYTEDQSMLMKLLETFTCDSFIHYVSGDLEITKMYFAAFYSDLIERVKSFGLSAVSFKISPHLLKQICGLPGLSI